MHSIIDNKFDNLKSLASRTKSGQEKHVQIKLSQIRLLLQQMILVTRLESANTRKILFYKVKRDNMPTTGLTLVQNLLKPTL